MKYFKFEGTSQILPKYNGNFIKALAGSTVSLGTEFVLIMRIFENPDPKVKSTFIKVAAGMAVPTGVMTLNAVQTLMREYRNSQELKRLEQTIRIVLDETQNRITFIDAASCPIGKPISLSEYQQIRNIDPSLAEALPDISPEQ